MAEILRVRPDFNCKLQNCRNSKENPEAKGKLEVDDLLALIASADEANLFLALPIFATADPDSTPSRQLLEGGLRAILMQFAALSESCAEMKASLERACPSGRYATDFPVLGGVDRGNVEKYRVTQRVKNVQLAGLDEASDSESGMLLVRNARNDRKAAKRMRDSESPSSPVAPSAPRSYSAAVAAAAPNPTQGAQRPVIIGKSTTSALKASAHPDLPKKVYRIGNVNA
jgi:hypothetical protein